MSRAAALAFDLRALPDDFHEEPFPTYHELRRWDPVHRCPDGSYFLTPLRRRRRASAGCSRLLYAEGPGRPGGRRRRPGGTDPGEILSALLAAEDAGDRLTEVELLPSPRG